MNGTPIRLGTRASLLAMTQSRWVAERLSAALGREVELVEVTTTGDRNDAPLAQLGGTGVFVCALREALLDGTHRRRRPLAQGPAHRRRPTASRWPPYPCARTRATSSWPATGSPSASCPPAAGSAPARRVARRSSTPSASVWRSWTSGAMWTPGSARSARATYDAVVLARAGLARIGRLEEATEVLDPLQMLPAPGQGALAVETRDERPRHRGGRPGRRTHPRRGHRRARGAGHARGRLRRSGRGTGRGGRGGAGRRALGEGRSALSRRDAGGPDVRHRRPSRRRRRR